MIIQIADQYNSPVRFSQADVIAFSEVSKDKNQLHLDPEFAAKSIFKKPIIHGFLAGSAFSRIFGMEYPGHGSIYQSQSLEFKRPMFVETDYMATVTVLEIDPVKHSARFKTEIKDVATNKVTISGEAVIINTEVF